jgi:transposase
MAAIDRGMPRKEVAQLVGVSLSTIKRRLNRRRQTGDVETMKIPGRPAVMGEVLRQWLPNATRERELCGGGCPLASTLGALCVLKNESGTHISMDRLRSRTPRGVRAYGKVPKNRGKNLTLVASMSLEMGWESRCALREPPMPRRLRSTWSTSWLLRFVKGRLW